MIVSTSADGDTIRSLTPPEYIKLANAREYRVKHALDLRHFIDFYTDRVGRQGVTPSAVEEIIADYLDALEEGPTDG